MARFTCDQFNVINYHTRLRSHLHRRVLIGGTLSEYNYAQEKMETKEYHVLIINNPLLNRVVT